MISREHRLAHTLLVLILVWCVVVLAFFAIRHPVRSGGLWLEHLGGICCNFLLVLGASALGRRMLIWLKAVPERTGERLFLSLGLGFFFLTYGVLAIGLIGGLYPWVGWVLVMVPMVVWYRDLRTVLFEIRDTMCRTNTVGAASAAFVLILTPVLVATLWLSLAPPTAHDSLVYHLNLPKRYAADHRILPVPLNFFSNMPHNLEILTTLTYLLGGETAARVLDFVMRLAVSAGTFILARRFIPAPGSLLAVLLFFLSPTITSARTAGNTDLGMALFFLLAVIAILEAEHHRRDGFLWLAALFAGYLMGCKYTGLFFALSVLALMIVGLRPLPVRRWGIVLLLFGIPVAPWLVKNLATTGNPVYPLFPSVFESPGWSKVLGDQLVRWQRSIGMGRGLGDYLLLPWNAAVEGQMGRNYRHFDGVISPLPLAFIPLAALMRNRAPWLKMLGLCVIPFVCWAATSQQIRFLIPLLPLTSTATAGILWSFDRDALGSKKNYVRGLGVACVLAFLAVFQVPMLARNAGAKLPVVTGDVSREEYLSNSVHSYPIIRHANETLSPEARILMIWENEGYYLERPYLADSSFEASQIAQWTATAGTPAAFAADLRAKGVTHVIYNHVLGRVFAPMYGPGYDGFLDQFITGHLEALHTEEGLTLYRFK